MILNELFFLSMGNLRINQNIAPTSVKVIGLADITSWQHCDISNATDILNSSVHGRMSGAEAVPRNEQRTALPSKRHVANAKIGEGGYASVCSNS